MDVLLICLFVVVVGGVMTGATALVVALCLPLLRSAGSRSVHLGAAPSPQEYQLAWASACRSADAAERAARERAADKLRRPLRRDRSIFTLTHLMDPRPDGTHVAVQDWATGDRLPDAVYENGQLIVTTERRTSTILLSFDLGTPIYTRGVFKADELTW